MTEDLTALLPPCAPVLEESPYADAAEEFILRRLAGHWRPKEIIPIEEWARQRLRLERSMSSEWQGQPYDVRNVPHVRLIFDFLRDPIAEELNIMKSSAAAMSTAVMVAITYYFWFDPRNVIYLISNQDEARKLSKQVMQPFLRQVFGTVVDDEDQANLHLTINGAELFFGSPTEAMMRNKQVWLVVEDESDTMDDQLTGGGQDLEVAAKERTKMTQGRKVIRLCTPLKKWNPTLDKRLDQPGARIHRNYLRGDQRELRVPCPLCENVSAVVRDDLITAHCRDLAGKYDTDRVREETWWRCPSCAGVVYDRSAEKRSMMSRLEWVPTAKAASRRVWSAQHTDTCSLIGNASWGEIMAAYHETEGDPSKRAAVLRAHFAEPEDTSDTGADRTREVILQHCGAYRRGTCPIPPAFLVIAADVQKDASYFPWVQCAFDHFGNQYVLDCGEALDTDELERLFWRPIPLECPDEKRPMIPGPEGPVPAPFVYCTHGVMDSGHSAKEDEADPKKESVYRFCAGTYYPLWMRFRWVPLKGRGGKQIKDVTEDSRAKINSGVEIPLHHFHDSLFKRQLYLIRLSDNATPHAQKAAHPIIRFFREKDADEGLSNADIGEGERYVTFEQMVQEVTAERIMERWERVGGQKKMIRKWDVPSGRKNNIGDCVKMCAVAAHLIMRSHGQHTGMPGVAAGMAEAA